MVLGIISKLMRYGGRRAQLSRSRKIKSKKLDMEEKKLDSLEFKLENITDKMIKETEEIEGIKHKIGERKSQFSVMGGQFSSLTLQDIVGASFGALMIITQQVWEISSKLAPFNLAMLVLISFSIGFSLVYFSRRRKLMSLKVFHTCFLRAVEIYLISFLTSVILIMVLNTAGSFDLMMKQTILVTLPAVITAATADLLFY